ncbi:fibronectin type III-like domain-contianing protein [Maribacter polysaccharolyticus]|uniref:fibronectin type III-like domain-contianing protein n=1 Tax=Maribacter polysaccharolyticus TaxID=3020831 RepID=UPI00237F2036|nr:fibronectin type III-like domain-contianing protein [Maribacter polysaccharolyticus]MDE3744158.1 fibronectin type III-like domain-contianing protein [Maribacter polysaccharolyticus]
MYIVPSVDVENTGNMDGQEIVQVYVRDMESSVPRPVKELKGFQKVYLKAGKKKTIDFTLVERDFSFWDVATKEWKLEPGVFEICIGSASNTILAKAQLEIK